MLRKLAVVLLAVLAVLATTIPASSASAATPVTVASLLMFNGDIVQGIDVPRARVAVSPPVGGATVQLQYLKTVNGVQHWYSGGTVRTRAGGVVIVKFALDGTGTTTWRAVVTAPVLKPVTSQNAVVRVYPQPSSATGPETRATDILALERLMCISVAKVFTNGSAISGPEETALADFASGVYEAGQCDNKHTAAAVWAGLNRALGGYVVGKPLDRGAEKAWGRVLDAILTEAHANGASLRTAAKNLFNNWLLQDEIRVGDAYEECLRNAGADTGWPQRTWQCTLRARGADDALDAAML